MTEGSKLRRLRILLVVVCSSCTAGDDIPAPLISSVVPNHGSSGAIIMIEGDYFCQQPGGDEDPLACANIGVVDFDQIPATAGTYSERMIMVEVPALEPGNVNVSVSVSGRRSNRVDFLVDGP